MHIWSKSTIFDLNPKKVDIFRFSLDQPPQKLMAVLRPEEQGRAERFRFDRHRRRFIVGRAVLKTVLARYLGLSALELVIMTNAAGKPYLNDFETLSFNLSHSRDLGLLAVGQQPLGIDCEYFSKRPYQGIAEQVFSPAEAAALKDLSPFAKPLHFFSLWTQKEAFVKAVGASLYSTPTPEDQKQWQIKTFMPKLACCAAVCYSPAVADLFFYDFSGS